MALELKAQSRVVFGKRVGALRKQALVPAELYGYGMQNQHLALAMKDFKRVYKAAGENTIVSVAIGDKQYPTFIYDVTVDPLTSEPTHVDLYQVRMDKKLQVKVPLEFIGESPAVKNLGGLLVKTMQELSVEALPDKIPHHFTVDIGSLAEIGSTVRLSQLVIPSDVKVLIDMNTVVVTIKAKMTEEEEAALQAKGAPETVKVEAEEKKEERAAAKDAAAEPGADGAPAPAAKTAPAAKASSEKKK